MRIAVPAKGNAAPRSAIDLLFPELSAVRELRTADESFGRGIAMSSIGMLGTAALESLFSRSTQSSADKFKQAFQQLGQDLQSGNIQQAEGDLATLQPNFNPNQPTSTTSSSTT